MVLTRNGGRPGSDPFLLQHVTHQVEEQEAGNIRRLVQGCQWGRSTLEKRLRLTMFISWDFEVVVKPSW